MINHIRERSWSDARLIMSHLHFYFFLFIGHRRCRYPCRCWRWRSFQWTAGTPFVIRWNFVRPSDEPKRPSLPSGSFPCSSVKVASYLDPI